MRLVCARTSHLFLVVALSRSAVIGFAMFFQRFFFEFCIRFALYFHYSCYLNWQLSKSWRGVTVRYPVVALALFYVYFSILCIFQVSSTAYPPQLTIYRIFYIFMRNSVKRASKEMNHVVNANECFEIDSHEMSKTHLQLAHTHTHTHARIYRIHSHRWHEYCIWYCKLQL